MKFIKKHKYLILTIIVILIVLIILIIGLLMLNSNQAISNQSNNSTSSNLTQSYPISSPQETFQNIYTSSDNKFSFTYPNTWKVIRDNTGVGLIPIERCNIDCSQEILTIFSVSDDETPKDWAIGYDGGDYTSSKNIEINGYTGFYAIYARNVFTDIKYTLENNGLMIHSTFRQIDNTSGESINNTKYTQDIESIVNSIKFLN